MFAYASTGAAPVLEGATAIAFEFIRAQMDRDTDRWEDRCAKNREVGARGGRPRKQEPEKTERFFDGAEKTKCFSEKPNESVTVTVEDTVTVTETVEDIITPPTPSKRGKANFQPENWIIAQNQGV